MSAITASDARRNLFGLIQQVNDDHSPVEVVSKHGNAVLISKDDFDAITETAYLLRNAKGAQRLLGALERARRGEFETHELIEE
ncbi:type II toxin-antitoxin system Phd/YefM family antitoxin [Clavibacter sp. Sh2141]|jgi:antitoxin YefM|uniref:Antitoxin n=1 Tax=Clavibacter californiensis TaxID=1401995 RepID=A0ABX9N601_9MICO|nr:MULTISPECIES: type II toxin-antitoxin system prevent-host-death family antitoxin [Clavibacter]OUE29492.1 Antitoxin RelJ [Clavibacter michiganensis]PPF53252.1 type II toxin-antitoxin system prevent-host-death family antitoxin [Clavibacter michiganensis]PPF55659.1 type II toxin-antitoxin system prevent-host-death family antitoxin [Clavibacter michiganensis]RII92538.1 type II toxin-antitoxin system prevent-host-death family antitoxin [Clavibacter californiensis]UKF80624.1 type II toxin-antitox